jgi:hypothetical protein
MFKERLKTGIIWKVAGVALGLGLVLTQFTNCDVYSESSVFSPASVSTCEGGLCPRQNPDHLELGTVSRLYVQNAQVGADLGGDCNEAGFPSNAVNWEIVQGGTVIRTCSQTSNCGICVNGRFQTYVNFAGMPPQNDMQVRVEIIGYVDTTPYSNPILARKTVQVQTN